MEPTPETPSSALDVAAALLTERPGLDQMQLHKLLYLIQAAHLAWFNTPAFDDEQIQAWMKGPVIRKVAGHYMQFETMPIDRPVSGYPTAVPNRTKWVVKKVVERYGGLDGSTLAKLTKIDGGPWRQIRGDLPDDQPSDREIPTSLIAEFHRRFGVTEPPPLTEAERESAERFFDGDGEALADLFEISTGTRPTIG